MTLTDRSKDSRGTSYPQRPGKHAPVVYFILEKTGAGRIKIGTTTNLAVRFAKIKTSSAEVLEIVHVEPGGEDREAELHRRFAFCRHRREWFNPAPELLAYIRRPDARSPIGVDRHPVRLPRVDLRPLLWPLLGVWILLVTAAKASVSRRARRGAATRRVRRGIVALVAYWVMVAWYWGQFEANLSAAALGIILLTLLGKKADR